MRIHLICVGRLSRIYEPIQSHYAGLLRRYLTLEIVEVPETPIQQGKNRVLAQECRALSERMRPTAFTVVLDRLGREFSSETLSRYLMEQKLSGRSDFQFILGGALGLDESVIAAADLSWSLSKLTFPHQLARCVALEQLFRAVRIERGEPYHY